MSGKFQPQPPRQQPLAELDPNGKPTNVPTKAWYQWLSLIPPRLTSPAVASTPATSVSAGVAGQITYDANFLYICIATNTWKRLPLNAF